MKKIVTIVSIFVLIVGSIYLYQVLRPTVIFHTYAETGYLGKVSTFAGTIDYLHIKNYKAVYRMPYKWNWTDGVEIAFFTTNCWELFKKEDLDFWKIDIFLDENGYGVNTFKTKYFWSK